MRIHNVHSRDLEAQPDRLAPLLDGLGRPGDRLWPTDTWPTIPMELDRSLAVGARGGHGKIRYRVEAHEPGRSVVFRFPRKSGFDGFHRLDIEALGPCRSRMTHTLDCRVAPRSLPLVPIILTYHNAVVEDLLDRAEEAVTGERPRPARRPLWLSFANRADIALARLRGTVAPVAAA
jgi:hypothetical protein